MRLLSKVDGVLSFTIVSDKSIPYVALSHTWGEGEVTYQDVLQGKLDKAGYVKIEFLLTQAELHGYEHVWIDTCCIDKTDRVELGEAINRMWEWYSQCAICLVYLSDATSRIALKDSRWFTRGWTLQELLAPNKLKFYNKSGQLIEDRDSLQDEIQAACGIDILRSSRLVSIAERFRWSLTRQTSVPEDSSYCLAGLLEVNLVFNYGEDADHARENLLEAVGKEHGMRVIREIRKIIADEAARSPVAGLNALTVDDLLVQLEFAAEYRRWEAIATPHRGTCTWILRQADFQKWCAGDFDLLWIKGKPGSGKSTLMKFIESSIVGTHVSFYFNARGALEEHTTLGMYRSILAQLLRRTQVAVPILLYINQRMKHGIRWSVTVPTLQDVLRTAVDLLEDQVTCYVDALDECSLKEVQEMVHTMSELANARFRVCFASRHYPALTILRSKELILERQQHDDIPRLVHGRLALQKDPLELRRQIIDKANGVVFWAILVIHMLNNDLSSGHFYRVQQRLNDLPVELEDLLAGIILSETYQDVQRFQLAMCWLMFSYRPLKLHEFYAGLMSSLCIADMAPASAIPIGDMKEIPTEQLERFVSSCSRGLAEVTRDSTVQVVHESVRDFLLHHDGMSKLLQRTDQSTSHWAHDRIAAACMQHLLCESSCDATSNIALDQRVDALTDYIKSNAIRHGEEAAAIIKQADFLLRLRDVCARSSRFPKLHLQKNKLPALVPIITCLLENHAFKLLATACELELASTSALGKYLAWAAKERDWHSYEALLQCGADVNGTYRGDSTLHNLTPFLDISRARILIDRGANVHAFSNYGETCLVLAVRARNKQFMKMLLAAGCNLNTGTPNNRPLSLAASLRKDLVDLLLENGLVLLDPVRELSQALCESVRSCDLVATELLLGRGADANTRDSGPALHVAARCIGSPADIARIIDALLAAGSDIEMEVENDTPLALAVQLRNFAAVERLLQKGANPNVTCTQPGCRLPLLHVACYRSDVKTAGLLTLYGADIEARDRWDLTALSALFRLPSPIRESYLPLVMLLSTLHARIEVNDDGSMPVVEQSIWGDAWDICTDILECRLPFLDTDPERYEVWREVRASARQQVALQVAPSGIAPVCSITKLPAMLAEPAIAMLPDELGRAKLADKTFSTGQLAELP